MFLLITALFLWTACEPPVVFTEAQPKGVKTQSTFSKKYQGTYFCDSDSSWVKVSPKMIYKEKTFFFITTRSEVEQNEFIELEGNIAYIDYFETFVQLEEIDDNLLAGNVTLRDTFFEIGEKGILKSYKGNEIIKLMIVAITAMRSIVHYIKTNRRFYNS